MNRSCCLTIVLTNGYPDGEATVREALSQAKELRALSRRMWKKYPRRSKNEPSWLNAVDAYKSACAELRSLGVSL